MYNIYMKVPNEVKTKLDSMTLLDRFLFNETVEDVQIYNDMIEILLDGQVHLIPWTETEKELRVSPELRQVRLDVIGMDELGEVYQMEMQQENTYNLPKRSRYYQAQIDVTLLEPGSVNFNKMNDLTTILVSPFDLFGYGLYRYIFEEHCQEIPELKLNDGARRIFINTNGSNQDDFSKEFLDFMKYISAPEDEIVEKSGSEKIKRIHNRVCTVKRSEKIGVKLMQQWEEMYYMRMRAIEEGHAAGHAAGHAEGHAEGHAKGRLEILKDLVRDGVISVFEAAERMGMSVEEFQNDNNQRIGVESPEINR